MMTQTPRDLLGEFHQPGPKHLRIGNVFRERGFVRYRLGLTIWDYVAVINSVSQSPIVLARRTKEIMQRLVGKLPQFANRLNAQTIKCLSGDFADSPQAPNRQEVEKSLHFFAPHDEKSIRFV